jgi:O-antigen/teichoic acid export membrane protein
MRFVISLIEQGMGSLVTFGVNLWLIRNGRAESYGVYVFWYAIAWVLATCQNTLTIVHLSSLPAGADRLAERREPERVLFTATLVILLVVTLGVLTANQVLRAMGSELRELSAALFIPAFLLYQFARAFAFSRRRPAVAAALTGAVMISSALGLAGDRWAGFTPDATRVLVIVGVAYGVCAVLALWRLEPGLRPMLRGSGLRRYAAYLRGSGWMMLGAASAEVITRLYSFMVVGMFGTQALARLSAVQVVIRPAWMLSAAWTSIGFPAMATQRANGDRRALIRTMLSGGLLTAVGSAGWSGMVILAWPWISSALYRGKYPLIGDLGWLWGGNAVLGSITVALNTAMLVLGRFRPLALMDLAGAVVCGGCVVLLLGHFDYSTGLIGILVGQTAQIALMAGALARPSLSGMALPAARRGAGDQGGAELEPGR